VQGTVQGVPHSAHVIVAIRELLPSGLVSLELRLLTKQGAALRAAQDVTRLARIVAVHPNAADSFIESHVTSKHSAVKAEAASTCNAGRGAGRGAGSHLLGAHLHRHPGLNHPLAWYLVQHFVWLQSRARRWARRRIWRDRRTSSPPFRRTRGWPPLRWAPREWNPLHRPSTGPWWVAWTVRSAEQLRDAFDDDTDKILKSKIFKYDLLFFKF